MAVDYSKTPLSKKLGIKPGFKLKIINAPCNYTELTGPLPDDVTINQSNNGDYDFIHFFTQDFEEMDDLIGELKQKIRSAGMIWVSWPKKSSRVETTVNGNDIRQSALACGLVDVKVCSVDDIWSGLKLVIPVKGR